mmetsp:Transcript_35726/g.43043  ORF Transcript_35726/g.43043 Transcript_35726/m.43043 type:complete len:102 (+) Transcript_35726:1-306(+)
MKKESRYVENPPRPHTREPDPTKQWESGFGIEKEDTWIPIEHMTTQITYEILREKKCQLKNYTPNPAHKVVNKVQKFPTPEERNYWWKLNHNLISVKRTES